MKQHYIHLQLTLMILLSGLTLKAEVIDSLKAEMKKCKQDTCRARILNELSDKYYNINIDSSLLYAEKAYTLAVKSNAQMAKGDACANIGDALYYKGEYKKSIQKHQDAINAYETAKYAEGIIDSYISIGQAWKEMGDYQKAIENLLIALKSAEKNKDYGRTGRTMISLGVLFLDQDKYADAYKYSTGALKYLMLDGNKAQIANAYARIGNIFNRKNNPANNIDSTLFYYGLSLNLFTEINHQRGIAVIYNNMAGIYEEKNESKKAIDCYLKAFEMRSSLGDQNGMAIILYNLGSVYKSQKKYSLALKYLNQSLDICLKINKPEMASDNYSLLSECFAETGNYKNAYLYKKRYTEVKDSIVSEESNKVFAEMQTKYETDKKEKEIKILNKNKAFSSFKMKQQKETMKLQNYIIYGSLGTLLVVLVLLFFVLRLFIHKKRTNRILQDQFLEISQQKEEISTQRDEIEAQRDMVTNQKDKILHIHEELTSSIRYAQKIQDAVLPSDTQMAELLSDFFVFYQPKDIVSGDFYWAASVNNKLYFCVADCTGHGVPGAFMSMLGISFLNEIVLNNLGAGPAKVLDLLRAAVINSLKQKDSNYSAETLHWIKDGLDIGFCELDKNTLELKYAGANNPLYIIKAAATAAVSSEMPLPTATAANNTQHSHLMELKGDLSAESSAIVELKADKMPIGIYRRMDPFSEHIIQLERGDMLYLFSDGFADQFGGPLSKKFKYKPFKAALKNNSHLSMENQKKVLEQTFIDWKRNQEQIDDITILGIRI